MIFLKGLTLSFLIIAVFIVGVLFGIEGIQWKVYNEILKPCNDTLGANQICVLVAVPQLNE